LLIFGSVAGAADPFPSAKPETVGLAAKDLDALTDFVAGFARSDTIVGGEVLIIKNGHTVLRRGFGWKDRDKKQEMPVDAIYCIRSMTKPVVGVAIQMLVDDRKLSIDDPVAKYLPAFDNEKSRAITIRELLTHTGGLKLSTLAEVGFDRFKDVRGLADLIGKNGPELKPGTRFNYSDDGADTLTAVVGAVSGKPAEQFIQERILDPLGMADTICVLKKDDPRLPRIATAYAGAKGAWVKFFAPDDKPIFPFFLGSQGMYSTTTDYARFLKMIADGGTWEGKRLLSKEAVARILTAPENTPLPTGFDGRTTTYGQLMEIYIDKDRKVRAFGHGGSDGTHSYAFPEKNLFAFYFTQSRGTLTGLDFEKEVGRRLVEPGKAVVDKKLDAKAVEPFLGLYWMDEVKCPLEVLVRDGVLWVVLPWQAELELAAGDKPEKWTAKLNPAIAIAFQRDGSAPAHTLALTQAPAAFHMPRLKPEAGLPTADAILKLRNEKLGADKLATLGAVRAKGTIEQSTKKSGTVEVLFDGMTHYRNQATFGAQTGVRGLDGETVWMVSAGRPPAKPEGELTAQARFDHPMWAAADWKPLFESIEVLKRFEADKTPALMLRAVPKGLPARYLTVEESTGRLMGDRHIEIFPGIGRLGKDVQYRDFKDVNGVQLPTKITETYPTPLIGRFERTYTGFETKVTLPAGAFAMPAK
jgi:CubicO group peptidase (beta-lactamase class C family)